MRQFIEEDRRQVPVAGEYEVIVCGGGPAGIAAAIAAAKNGARTLLIENHGCLGGVWTAGLVSYLLDWQDKGGLLEKIMTTLEARGAKGDDTTFDVEAMKFLLEELCVEAGVEIRYHTRLVDCTMKNESSLQAVITESKSGREAWLGQRFIDCTGDGDLAAFAGCGFDVGKPENGETQPMSMLCLLTGIKKEDMLPYLVPLEGGASHKDKLYQSLCEAGIPPSYGRPTLFHIHDDLYELMSNHEYGVSALDAGRITQATIQARREVNQQINALRKTGGIWQNLKLVATAEHIGVREGRRIHGNYTLTKEDLIAGRKHEDAVCCCTFGVDVHATNPDKSKGYDNDGISVKPYDIPLRSLQAKGVDNLFMAGRCISGDFYAHASYRVTGNAVAMGEAIGEYAANDK